MHQLWLFTMFINVSKMKLVVKYRSTKPGIEPVITEKGSWFDLKAAETVEFKAPHNAYNTRITTVDVKKVSLGIAMQMPKGIEALVVPRSSLYGEKGVTLVNSVGVIDPPYCGDNDIWSAKFKADRDATIIEGERIVQFRLIPSQRASIWTKIKWLFVSEIVFEKVEFLTNPDRGGYGASGGYKEV